MQIIVDRVETTWPWLAEHAPETPIRDVLGHYNRQLVDQGKYLRDSRTTGGDTLGTCLALEVFTAHGLESILEVLALIESEGQGAQGLHLMAVKALKSKQDPGTLVEDCTAYWARFAKENVPLLNVVLAGDVDAWLASFGWFDQPDPTSPTGDNDAPGLYELRRLTGVAKTLGPLKGDQARAKARQALVPILTELADRANWWYCQFKSQRAYVLESMGLAEG